MSADKAWLSVCQQFTPEVVRTLDHLYRPVFVCRPLSPALNRQCFCYNSTGMSGCPAEKTPYMLMVPVSGFLSAAVTYALIWK